MRACQANPLAEVCLLRQPIFFLTFLDFVWCFASRAKRRARDDPLMAGLLTRGSRRTRRGYVEEPTVDDSYVVQNTARPP